MPLFRREKLHERLARLGGLEEPPAVDEPVDTTPRWGEAGIHGVPRPRRWDVVVRAKAPGLSGQERSFVALPDGTLLVDDDIPDGVADPLAQAVETRVRPPYRAEAVRREGDAWAVAARQIAVVELPDVDGEELTLTVGEEGRRLVVDGAPTFGSVPALERVAGARFGTYSAHATRLDDDLFELRLTPL